MLPAPPADRSLISVSIYANKHKNLCQSSHLTPGGSAKMASTAAEALILRVILRHGRPRLQEQHQELEVVPHPRGFQQLQEELAPSLLRLHVLHPHLGGRREGRREGEKEGGREQSVSADEEQCSSSNQPSNGFHLEENARGGCTNRAKTPGVKRRANVEGMSEGGGGGGGGGRGGGGVIIIFPQSLVSMIYQVRARLISEGKITILPA